MTQEELEARYKEVGNLRALSEELSVSKTTLQKYLSDVASETKPWSSTKRSSVDYYRKKFRKEAMESVERAMVNRKRWKDVNGRTIPREAIETLLVYPPKKMVPLIPIYAKLYDGTNVIFMMHPDVPWVSRPQEEPSSDEESLHTYDLAASDQALPEPSEPDESPE